MLTIFFSFHTFGILLTQSNYYNSLHKQTDSDQRIWSATPPAPETSACIVFGGPACDVPIHFYRLQTSGALAGYSDDRSKVWDSHRDDVDGAVVDEKRSGSLLELTEDGVHIYFVNEDNGEVVTWKIDAPPLMEEVVEETSEPTISPVEPQQQLGFINGFIWDDTSTNDGLYTAGDVPMGSILVSLDRCENDDGNIATPFMESTSISSAGGTFIFDELEPGSYRIRVTPPSPEDDVGDDVNNATGGSGAAQFTGGGGAEEEEEPQWQFVAKNANGVNNANAVAEDSDLNEDGTSDCIEVGGVDDGGGVLQHSLYVGMIQTTDDVEPSTSVKITVSGIVFFDSNGNGLMDDDDNESSISGNDMINNVVVDLYDCQGDEEWILLTRTDSSGKYEFTIPSGTATTNDLTSLLSEKGITQFRVIITLPELDDDGEEGVVAAFSPPSIDSDVDPTSGKSACWDIDVDGRGSIIKNAGITMTEKVAVEEATKTPTTTPTASPSPQQTSEEGTESPGSGSSGTIIIGGYAFLDANDNGNRDSDAEVSVGDVELWLFSCAPPSSSSSSSSSIAQGFLGGPSSAGGTSNAQQEQEQQPLATQRTNAQGLYNFINLSPGNYYEVEVIPPVGYKLSSSSSSGGGDEVDGVDNDFDPSTGRTVCFELVGGGEADISWNVGLVPVEDVVISGLVYDDINNNGSFEDGEPALPDVKVALFDCNSSDFSIMNATTDENGMYGFNGVSPGSYKVKFSHSEYQLSVTATDEENGADSTSGFTACIEYEAGEEVYSLDAGMYKGAVGNVSPPSAVNLTDLFSPSSRPTDIGDGTKCSGSKCATEGMCRNKAGLCGAGIGFCNPESVWDPSCPPPDDDGDASSGTSPTQQSSPTADETVTPPPSVTLAPSTSVGPSVVPTISLQPTLSTMPSSQSSLAVTNKEGNSGNLISSVEGVSMCNEDGYSVGITSPGVQNTNVMFKYALRSPNGVDPGLVAKFESDLNSRLACVYFDDPCLECGEEDGGDITDGSGTAGLRKRSRVLMRRMEDDDSSCVGISSLPRDVPNPVEGKVVGCQGCAGNS